MHRLRSPETIGGWTILLGLFLAVGPLVQSVAAGPCNRAPDASGAPEAVTTPVSPGAQWACPDASPAPPVLAVSSERPSPLLDRDLESGSTTLRTPARSVPKANQRSAPLSHVSLVLRTLRPVVLQI